MFASSTVTCRLLYGLDKDTCGVDEVKLQVSNLAPPMKRDSKEGAQRAPFALNLLLDSLLGYYEQVVKVIMEAAGLALAILPLLLSQLDNYVQGLQTLKGFRARRYRQQLDEYFTNIGTQHALFLNTLERTLDGVVEYQDGIDDLINNPSGEAWKRPELQQKLERKLERSYWPFTKTMGELSSQLEDLKRRLIIEQVSSAETIWKDASILEREVRKFRDIFSKSIYADLLHRISTANTILDTLLKQSEYRNQPRRRIASKRPLLRYRKARKSAHSLHKTIIRGKCWNCPCKASHKVHFVLNTPYIDTFDTSTEASANPCFDLVLTSISAADAGCVSSLTKSYKLAAESEIIQSSIGVRHICHSGHAGHNTPQNHKKKTVQFAPPETACEFPRSSRPQLPPIVDICAAISAVIPEQGSQTALGWLSDESHRHNITYIRNVGGGLSSQSLEDLITASCRSSESQTSEKFFFSQLDRLRIAVNLACSVLQFHGSWLKNHWRPRDLMFDPQDIEGIGDIYIPWNVGENIDDPSVRKGQNSPTLVRNQILFPLGLVLVELSLCKNLESDRRPEDEDQNEAHANLKTATRLLPKVEELSGPEYADVVDRCLSWHDRKETSLETEKMQEEVFQLIVLPLIENLRSFEDSFGIY
ncbi:hypothetical protein N7457_006473 [Penicillium paradoxum]|uniref:uncharacterized protein n=1 Tax=Penicillium paradoxum TaxID=176176 RepID=UPI0025468AA3|nr:uncharacterized protein N7457_006473 [Penicillium paradoxum]KAJ5781313.1 hypothetical protein N7457_006473 [Penicillium paradoxum]